MVQDKNELHTDLMFYLVDGSSPPIIGLDVKKYSDTQNRQKPSQIIFQRTCDTRPRCFSTYNQKDESGKERLRMEIVPHEKVKIRSLVSSKKRRSRIVTIEKFCGLPMPAYRK